MSSSSDASCSSAEITVDVGHHCLTDHKESSSAPVIDSKRGTTKNDAEDDAKDVKDANSDAGEDCIDDRRPSPEIKCEPEIHRLSHITLPDSGKFAFLLRYPRQTIININLLLLCIVVFAVLLFWIIKANLSKNAIAIEMMSGRECVTLRVSFCHRHHIQYSYTALPNRLDQSSQENIHMQLQEYEPLISVKCYTLLPLFLCSLYAPKCNSTNHVIQPCKSLCKEATRRCEFFLAVFSLEWPYELDCDRLEDNSDADICVGFRENQLLHRKAQICSSDGFRCDKVRCIPKSWVCDGYLDCQDGSDERNCSNCTSNQFYCGKDACIEQDDICDGIKDCPDGRDERQCLRLRKSMGEVGEGRLEAWSATTTLWTTVCGENWDSSIMSHKACRSLGYSKAIETRVKDETLQPPNVQNRLGSLGAIQNTKPFFYKDRSRGCKNGVKLSVHLKCVDFECGKPAIFANPTFRIVGGIESRPGQWPWLVALHGGPDEVFFCGGILISRHWVLSAAHCIGNQTELSGWTIKLGLTRRAASPLSVRRRKLSAVIKHPMFNSVNVYANDIALLKLDTEISYDEFLRPVCLPSLNIADHPATECTVIGWGKPKHGDDADYLNVVHEVKVPIINHTLCAQWYSLQEIPIANTMLCAGYAEGQKDACQGDSGGPLLCRNLISDSWFVAGVVSWGINCAQPQLPGIYTNVVMYNRWISETTTSFGHPVHAGHQPSHSMTATHHSSPRITHP